MIDAELKVVTEITEQRQLSEFHEECNNLISGQPWMAIEALQTALVMKRQRQALERDRAIAGFRARLASLAAGGPSIAGDEFHTSLEEADR